MMSEANNHTPRTETSTKEEARVHETTDNTPASRAAEILESGDERNIY